MNEIIPQSVLEIYNKIINSGHEMYLVGGCVRGLLMGRAVTDWDFATSATPEQIQQLFPDSFYDNPFGTVGIPYESGGENHIVEVTTYRKEGLYRDKRRPESVEWGKSIEEDLSRRDFTINAMALRLRSEKGTDKIERDDIIDPFGGQDDLNAGLIRAVGEAHQRFQEDALRMMRAVRIATQLNFEIEKKTFEAILGLRENISHVAWERIRDEFFKILASSHPAEGVRLLDRVKILEIILPELTEGKGVSMVRPGRHHTTDVYEHCLLALEHCPSEDVIVRLATLLHDVGKVETKDEDAQGLVVFYNHEVVGAHMVKDIAERFRLSKKQKDRLFTLVRWHMFTVDEEISDKAVRRFIRRVGIENIKDMIDLRIGDRLGSGAAKAESWRLKKFQERIEEQLNPPLSVHDLAIKGDDVMKILSIKPGPKVGKILNKLFEEVDENPDLNNREYLEKRAREINV